MVVHDVETHAAKVAVHVSGHERIASHLAYELIALYVVHTDCGTVVRSGISAEIEGVGTYLHGESLVVDELEVEVCEQIHLREGDDLAVAGELICYVVVPVNGAELEVLLMAIMQKLQQEEKTAAAPVSPAGTLVPVIDPESEPEYSIWENKKLQIESLPSYMFIQPTQAPKPEKPEHGGSKPTDGDSDHVPGTVCDPNFPDFCFWWPVDGEVVCVCGELG